MAELSRPDVEPPTGPAPEDLVIEDITVGDGPEATAGSLVSAHYVGVTHDGGEQFDASWDRGDPLEFRLGVGLAREVAAEGVRVNVVRPGIIETGIHAAGGQPDRVARLGPSVPMGRAGRAEEVAAAVLWLLGGESGYCTGSVLDVAGGR